MIKKINSYLLLTLLFFCFAPLLCLAQKSSVDLIYQTDSYAPPFYKGKSLNPNQGLVSVTAIPELITSNGQKISNNNIIYTWKKNGLVVQAFSGKGKNTLIFRGGVPVRDSLIEVTAVSTDSALSASQSINIPNVSPKIIFYENSPVYGIMFNKAISDTVNLTTDEFSVLAMPYFYSANTATDPNLSYTWSINDQSVGNQEQKNSFTTRVDTPGSGKAKIDLQINSKALIFQFLEKSYNIIFTKQ